MLPASKPAGIMEAAVNPAVEANERLRKFRLFNGIG